MATSQPQQVRKLIGLELRKSALQDRLVDVHKALTQAQDTMRAQAASLSALQTRLKAIEDQPMPGGPMTRDVPGMTINRRPSPAETIAVTSPVTVVKVLSELAEDPECTPEDRTRIARAIITQQRRQGGPYVRG